MASSVKIVLRKKKNQDGTLPLALRVTKDRKSSYVYLGYNVKESEWDASNQRVKKSHPNSVRLNNFLLKKKSEITDTLIELQTRQKDVSLNTIRRTIKPKENYSFFAQAAQFIDNMRKEGKYNRVKSDETRIKHFREFLNGADITFPEIDVALLNRFRAYLKGSRKVSDRTIANYLILIRTIFNRAIASHIVDQKYYPFGKGKMAIKIPDAAKIGLIASEVQVIEQLDLSDEPYLNHARNVWLVSFYFAGMRVSDVLRMKWSDFQNDRLHYTMGKNSKAGSLKMSDQVQGILAHYKGHPPKHDLIFPELKVLDNANDAYHAQRKISYAVKRLNTALAEIAKRAGITKPLTMHIARHTFGNISGDKIPVQILQRLYRHSSIVTTMGYQAHFTNQQTDDALDKVLNAKT